MRDTLTSPSHKDQLVRLAIILAWFTIFYNFLEGSVSMWFGAEEESVALFGFGADSFIEVASAIIVLWRFRQEAALSVSGRRGREKTATIGIGCLFLLLAAGTTAGSTILLWTKLHPKTTLPGVIVSVVSLSFMFFLWRAKAQVATKLSSPTLQSDACCSLACIKLSAILFSGSLLFLVAPSFWWADSVAALVLSFLIGREGWGIVYASYTGKGDHCCGC